MVFIHVLMLISSISFFLGGYILIDEKDIKTKIKNCFQVSSVPLMVLVIIDAMSLFIILA